MNQYNGLMSIKCQSLYTRKKYSFKLFLKWEKGSLNSFYIEMPFKFEMKLDFVTRIDIDEIRFRTTHLRNS